MNSPQLSSAPDGARIQYAASAVGRGRLALMAGACLFLIHGLTACRRHTDSATATGHHEEPVHFSPGQGLLLSRETWVHVGIELAPVTQRPVAANIKATAQVFREAIEASSASGTYRRGCAYASANVPAETAAECRPGGEVTVTKVDDPSLKFAGRILLVDRALQPATKTVEVVLELPDAKERLPIGAFVVATLGGSTTRPMLAVPRSALFKVGEEDFLYVKNGRYLLRVPVEVTAANAEWAGVSEGLYPGDRVAAKGVETLWLTELGKTQAGSHVD